VLLAPGGFHLELENVAGKILTCVVKSEPGDKYTPSVDRLFESAAKHYGQDLLAVVLTGMGDDGRRGSLAVKECGGRVIAESEETAVIFGMPQQAIRAGAVDEVLPLHEVPRAIQSGVARARSKTAKRRGSK
jgi:two-component system chemotaxis response regulator CheB